MSEETKAQVTQNTTEVKQPQMQPEKKTKRKEQTGRGGMIITDPISGTRDFPPENMRLQRWLFDKFKQTAKLFSFEEYDAPILEPAELYKRKAGEDITKQMYNFIDKSGLEVALRPEMTPSLARLILAGGKKLIFPIKWYTIAQCWRYENITKGRKREHYQWNMDIWGVNNVTAEAELLAAIVTFFRSIGLTSKDVGIKINSRKILQGVLESLNITGENFTKACVIVDKLDKLEENEVLTQLKELGIDEDVAKKVLSALAAKSLDELEKLVGDNNQGVREVRDLFELAKDYGIYDWLIFDASIVRGLAYYTGIVFEGYTKRSSVNRAICGGGRYDKILSTYGAKQDIPACGFGFGDCVIIEYLKEKKKLPKLEPSVEDVIIPFNEQLRGAAVQVAMKLREAGRSVDIMLSRNKRIKQSYSYADRIGASRAILIAPDEWENKLVRIKYLRDSKGQTMKEGVSNEYNVPFDEIATWKKPE
jgi:histidyl-tRNA synthetase